ncbi:uncharacterized protein EI97DRAFT_383140 [Westerdykella ornata]|uniref:Uncharacterized protein n=1 Tax=Westerdykella ornata TaxID=318751 RepID=A0A6A6JEW8_WESOR|nr:uncharacterized protein EI97DRAFT_383140 [Westerdykella ornata]KAF2273719.1 hypothetical protein EI97DRAFT_383140 [Westerdykella ornata]
MAPLRRYLRITKHSVLEVRIYLDRPGDAETWLVRRDNPALPRVIQAVRPLVLPKLREENERARGRSGVKSKKKGVKDVVVGDDFEVSIFLTDLSSRHSVLTKQKTAKDKPKIQSNSSKLTTWLTTGGAEQSVVGSGHAGEPIILREEDDDDALHLDDIPETSGKSWPNKRSRASSVEMISSDSEADVSAQSRGAPVQKRIRSAELRDTDAAAEGTVEGTDDKKKLALNTSYEGFSIYGRILCLIVKRKGPRTTTTGSATSSQQMLENWVSTQAAAEPFDDEDDVG